MTQADFHTGDAVRFQFGLRWVPGVVKEERGPIGVRGRHLYLVEFRPEPHAESSFFLELPAEDLRRAESILPSTG